MAPRKEELERYIREHIVRAREQLGMTQQELGRAIGKTNVSISDIERGRVAVSSVDLINIAKALHQPLNYFVPRTARIGTPEHELTAEEAKVVHDFRRLEYLELQDIFVDFLGDFANWAEKGPLGRVRSEYVEIFRRISGRD